MSLRAAFESRTPNITSSERTQNIKAKSIYTNMQELVRYGSGTGSEGDVIYNSTPVCPRAGKNYTGTMSFDICGNVTKYQSYELANSMAKGAAFNWDNCCRGLAAYSGTEDIYEWAKYEGMETWNANGTMFIWENIVKNTESVYGMKYWDGTEWILDRLSNITGPGPPYPPPVMTLDGSGVWIDPSNNLFGDINSCIIDKWQQPEIQPLYRIIGGNNTKKNYMVGYQPIGRRYPLDKWNLRFRPKTVAFVVTGGIGNWEITGTGPTGGCCPGIQTSL